MAIFNVAVGKTIFVYLLKNRFQTLFSDASMFEKSNTKLLHWIHLEPNTLKIFKNKSCKMVKYILKTFEDQHREILFLNEGYKVLGQSNLNSLSVDFGRLDVGLAKILYTERSSSLAKAVTFNAEAILGSRCFVIFLSLQLPCNRISSATRVH